MKLNKHPLIIRQFSGYLINGCIATAVHYSLLITLVEGFACNPLVASTVGFIFGAITGFSLNRKIVFVNLSNPLVKFLQYLLLTLISGTMNVLLMKALIGLAIHYIIAQIVATGSVVVFNFAICKLWIFRERAHAN